MKRSERLKAKYLELVAKQKALTDTVEARDSKDFTSEESTQFDALTVEIDKTFKDYDQALKAEKAQASAESLPALTASGDEGTDEGGDGQARKQGVNGGGGRVFADVVKDFAPGQKMGLCAAAVFKAKETGQKPLDVLADEGFAKLANDIHVAAEKRTREKSVNTLTSSAGGILVPQPLTGDVLPFLRPASTFLSAGPRHIQLVNGKFSQPVGATGATAAYVGQGAKKPVSEPTFAAINMSAKKLAGIVLLTKEAAKWTIIRIEEYIRDDLRGALTQTMDLNAFLGTGSGADPTGILNISGIGAISQAFADPKAPTLAELDAFASKAILYMTLRNLMPGAKTRWVMNYRSARYLADIRVNNEEGNYAFPEMQGENKRWKDFPVTVTNQIPQNLGSGTDESIIALVNFDDVLIGDEEDIRFDMSTEATVDVSGTLVHLWQQNMMGILAEMFHDFGLRRLASVVKTTGVRWGAP